MPRHARLDVPGALHHVIVRGIERQAIVRDDSDRAAFVERVGDILRATGTPCFAWALLSNHMHLLLRTGGVPLTTVMRRLLTGYAVAFNRRHHRHGYLFQNRYKSILCQEEPYLLELVRYLHLNPVRAAAVKDLRALDRYPWSGHSALIGHIARPWQAVGEVLRRFGGSHTAARQAYRAFVAEGLTRGRRPELSGGGLVRSAGGWTAITARRRRGDRLHGDERILGDTAFVEGALATAAEHLDRRDRLRARGWDLAWLVPRVAAAAGLRPADLVTPSKIPIRVAHRSLLCYWAVRELGLAGTLVGTQLGLTQSAVSRSVARGERLALAKGEAYQKSILS